MASKQAKQPTYAVSITDDPDVSGALKFSFISKSNGRSHTDLQPQFPAHQFVASVQGSGKEAEIHWIARPTEDMTRVELEEIARKRLTTRHEWIERLAKLVATVKGWAEELGWATRVVGKKLEDGEIGNYQAPGLLLQNEVVRLFLEPVARTAPRTEGVVDLYLMPSYDDIASLYYYNNRWNVHYMFEGSPSVGDIQETEPKPLTKTTLRRVFEEMKAHAG